MKNRIICSLVIVIFMYQAFFAVLLAAEQDLEQATVLGQVQTNINDSPYQLGKVAFFRVGDEPAPDQGTFHRVPNALVSIDSERKFNVRISPGQYYLGYFSSNELTPLSMLTSNNAFFLAVDSKRSLLKINATSGSDIHLGTVRFKPRSMQKSFSSFFSVAGRVVTGNDRPVQGYIVVAKNDFNDLRPAYTSEPTQEDGSFQIVLPPGSYALIARPQNIKFGRPKIGELFGVYGQTKPIGLHGVFSPTQGFPHVISGADGDSVKEITIFLFPIPDPEKTRMEQQGP